MRFLNFPLRFVATALLLCTIMQACKPKTKALKSPPHYNFATPAVTKLDPRLLEISGIAWDYKNNYFLAIDDGKNKLFFLDKEDKLVKQEHIFGKVEDYEDVAIYNGIPYILKSDGSIIKFVKDSATGKMLGLDVGTTSISGTNDFETMYTDPERKALVLICKNCETDDENSVSAYAFYPDSIGFDNKPLFVIDAAKVKALAPAKTSKFQPSAAAIHPVLHKLYIISSASNQLVIADLNGVPEAVYRLSPKLFPQPEGITFQQDGDMYISNEGLKDRRATLLKFEYVPISDSAKKLIGSAGYDFTTPDEKMSLGKHLHEISGMSYVPATNLILTENDEKGDIYAIDFKNKNDKVNKIKFGGKGDYEDIVYKNDIAYMLVSTGTVVEVSTTDTTVANKEYALERGGTNEFEAMYLDADGKSLILVCKQCSKEKDLVRQAYRFDISGKTFTPAYTINISEIQKILGDDQAEFKPSAAGINPVNGKLYIIASVGKVLVVASAEGKVEQVVKLDPVMYNQPEGMTFAPNGDLYISNEGGEGIATIYRFVYKK